MGRLHLQGAPVHRHDLGAQGALTLTSSRAKQDCRGQFKLQACSCLIGPAGAVGCSLITAPMLLTCRMQRVCGASDARLCAATEPAELLMLSLHCTASAAAAAILLLLRWPCSTRSVSKTFLVPVLRSAVVLSLVLRLWAAVLPL